MIREMGRGEYFGEKALLGQCRRTANVYALGPGGVELFCLYRNASNLYDLSPDSHVRITRRQDSDEAYNFSPSIKIPGHGLISPSGATWRVGHGACAATKPQTPAASATTPTTVSSAA
ncbi:unnamed protein product, partial [Protopolystoma xenopodis]